MAKLSDCIRRECTTATPYKEALFKSKKYVTQPFRFNTPCSLFRFLGSESLEAHALILGPWKSSRPLSSVLLSICLGVGTIILTLNKRVAKDIRRSNAPKAPIDLETKRRRRETERDTALYNSTNLLRTHRPFRE